jgi:hypothetical protein
MDGISFRKPSARWKADIAWRSNANRKTGRRVPMPFARQGETVHELEEAIPSRFNSESTLKVDIKSGDNLADFNLTSQ